MKFIGWLLKHVAGLDAYAIARSDEKTDRIKLNIGGGRVELVALMICIVHSLMSDSGKTREDIIEILRKEIKIFDE